MPSSRQTAGRRYIVHEKNAISTLSLEGELIRATQYALDRSRVFHVDNVTKRVDFVGDEVTLFDFKCDADFVQAM